MDKCPNCGFEEAPIWKNRKYQLHQQYSRIDELESWDDTKELAATLRKLGPTPQSFNTLTYSDGYYNYQYREDGIIVRIAKKFCEQADSMREPSKSSHNHRQRAARFRM